MAELTSQQRQQNLEIEVAAINSQRAQQKITNTLTDFERKMEERQRQQFEAFRTEVLAMIERMIDERLSQRSANRK